MQRIVLRFGLVAGAVLAAMMLVSLSFIDRIGFDRGAVFGYTTMVVAFVMVYFGVRSYRDTVAGGAVTFGQALKVGLLITAVATACYVVTWQVIYYGGLVPEFMEKYAAYSLEKARQAGASDADLARQTQDMADFLRLYQNPLVNIALTALEPLPVGLVFTLVSAGLLSRKRAADSAVAAAR